MWANSMTNDRTVRKGLPILLELRRDRYCSNRFCLASSLAKGFVGPAGESESSACVALSSLAASLACPLLPPCLMFSSLALSAGDIKSKMEPGKFKWRNSTSSFIHYSLSKCSLKETDRLQKLAPECSFLSSL